MIVGVILNTYSSDRPVVFKAFAQSQPQESKVNSVEIPIAIVYRLYHLGRAYDFQTIKLIHPNGRIRIEYVQLQLLIFELQQLPEIVNDPVAHHYLNILLPFLRSKRKDTKSGILVIEK